MRTSYVPWVETVFDQMQSYQRATVFVLGCLEREHILNLQALGGYWPDSAVQSENAGGRQPITGSASLPNASAQDASGRSLKRRRAGRET
jgi:hypothetical protein